VSYVPGDEDPADILTKPLGRIKLTQYSCVVQGIASIPADSVRGLPPCVKGVVLAATIIATRRYDVEADTHFLFRQFTHRPCPVCGRAWLLIVALGFSIVRLFVQRVCPFAPSHTAVAQHQHYILLSSDRPGCDR